MLRSHVRGRAPLRLLPANGLRSGREPKVRDPGPAPAVEHDVGRLEVPVNDALNMSGRQPRTDLPRQVECLLLRETTNAAEQGGEIFPVHVLHGDEVVPLELDGVVNAADIGVRHLARDPHLAQEALESFGVALQIRREELERNRLADLEVVGAIDFSHRASPHECDDPISIREHGSGQEAFMPG